MMNTIATRLEEPRAAGPWRHVSFLVQGFKGIAAGLRRQAPYWLPLAVLPLFLATGLIYAGSSTAMIAMAAPALFYCGYAIAIIKGIEKKLALRQAQLEANVARRVDEFSPSEVRLSRQYFAERVRQEIKRSTRHRLPLCIVTMTSSRELGTAVHASQLVKMTARVMRSEDCAGRLGRHVYALCLPHTTPAGADVVIQRLEREFEDSPLQFGLAYLPPGRSSDPEDLIQLALGGRETVAA